MEAATLRSAARATSHSLPKAVIHPSEIVPRGSSLGKQSVEFELMNIKIVSDHDHAVVSLTDPSAIGRGFLPFGTHGPRLIAASRG